MATHLGEAPSNILLQGFLEQITAHSQCADDKYRLLETKQGFSIRGLVRNLICFVRIEKSQISSSCTM